MMGNLFYRNVAPLDLLKMNYREIKYFNGWHEVMDEAERKAQEKAGKK